MAQAPVTAPETPPPAEPRSFLAAAAARFVRREHIPAAYSPWRHMALTLTIAAGIATIGALLARRARPIDWVLMPIFFVVANFMEWAVHRFPMHRPLQPRLMYKNHAQLHHIAFTDGNMPITSAPELGLVMMPWYTMIGLFVVASPVMIAAGLLRGPGLAGVFMLGAVAYFLCYETMHALYHLPDATLNRLLIGRSKSFRKLQAHHHRHHELRRMAEVNFNVTFPLMDRLFGTSDSAGPPDGPPKS
jgi:sterol desaturase/sphingolipid hydroxylase (fatty acid hydroxylase superfamily)